MNKKRKCCRDMRKMLLVFCFILLFAVFVFGGICVARTDCDRERIHRIKYYTSIEIQYGDTLWGIASRYSDTVDTSVEEYVAELKRMNHLTHDGIRAGDSLMVFYYAE